MLMFVIYDLHCVLKAPLNVLKITENYRKLPKATTVAFGSFR